MGQRNIKCCCKGKENNEVQFDSNEKQPKTNEKVPDIIKNENSKDLKAYVNFKNIKFDSNSNSYEDSNNDENIISKGKGVKKKTSVLQLINGKKK
jgi:hypothetical protein